VSSTLAVLQLWAQHPPDHQNQPTTTATGQPKPPKGLRSKTPSSGIWIDQNYRPERRAGTEKNQSVQLVQSTKNHKVLNATPITFMLSPTSIIHFSHYRSLTKLCNPTISAPRALPSQNLPLYDGNNSAAAPESVLAEINPELHSDHPPPS
jgi:hypothetical protein